MSRRQYARKLPARLSWTPPEGRPVGDAVELSVFLEGEQAFGSTPWPQVATPDPGSATTTAKANRKSVFLTVDTVANFVVGREYWLESIYGEPFLVKLRGIDTVGNRLKLDQPLSVELDPGATIKGQRWFFDIPSSDTEESYRRLRAEWRYEFDGEQKLYIERFDIVREPFFISLTESEIEVYDDTFGEHAGSLGRWKALIQGANNDVYDALVSNQVYPDLMREREILKTATASALLALFYAKSPTHKEKAKGFRERFDKSINQALTAKTHYDKNGDQTVSSNPGDRFATGDGYRSGEADDGRDSPERGAPASYGFRIG